MSENKEEYQQICKHPQCYEFPRNHVPRLRKFVSNVKGTKTQKEFNALYSGILREGFSVEELNNIIECCIEYLPYDCMLPVELKEKPVKQQSEKLKEFLERLRTNISLKLDVNLKIRKLQVSGDSTVITIPKELNVVYPRGSNVLTIWNKDKKSLFFFGVGSFMSNNNIVKVLGNWRSDWICFRSVLSSGPLSALVVPKQFLGYFKKGKANLFWNIEDSVLRVKSNLSFQEWFELEQRKAKERITTELSVGERPSRVKVKAKTYISNIGNCSNCGRIGEIRFWYKDTNSKGVPLCPNCYSVFEHNKYTLKEESKNEGCAIIGIGTLIYGELKKRFSKKEVKEKREVERRI